VFFKLQLPIEELPPLLNEVHPKNILEKSEILETSQEPRFLLKEEQFKNRDCDEPIEEVFQFSILPLEFTKLEHPKNMRFKKVTPFKFGVSVEVTSRFEHPLKALVKLLQGILPHCLIFRIFNLSPVFPKKILGKFPYISISYVPAVGQVIVTFPVFPEVTPLVVLTVYEYPDPVVGIVN
jgi:hypothetical protein